MKKIKLEIEKKFEEIVDRYHRAAKKGQSHIVRNDFMAEARIRGYLDGQFINASADDFFARIDSDGPAKNLNVEIESIQSSPGAATVHVECKDWHGVHYSDFLSLVRIDGQWKIADKVFYANDRS